MKIFSKNFLFGLVTGVLTTIIILIGADYLIFKLSSPSIEEVKKRESRLEPPPFSTVLADYNWKVKSVDGQELKMSDLKGKAVFLNFWATWCAECLAEMPSIQRLYERMNTDEVAFVIVSDESHEKVSQFVKEKGFTLPVYTLSGEPPKIFQSNEVPVTYILSRGGKIVFKHMGDSKWDDESSVGFIKELLQETF